MSSFEVAADPSLPPWEETAKEPRLKVSFRGRAVTALCQGDYRAYLYPVFTPAGVPVTAEAPVDHPHQQSVTVGTDRLDCIVSLPEPYSSTSVAATYNFWSNETYAGRAPGRIVSTSVESSEPSDGHIRLVQTLEWRSPAQWGSPSGPVVASETRTIDIRPGDGANTIDIRSQLSPTGWDLRIGPTVHAYFTVRMADGLRPVDGGTLVDSEGRTGAEAVRGRRAGWVDCSGSASYGHGAGLAVFPYPSGADTVWHLDDWGKISVAPFTAAARPVARGEVLDLAVRIVAHDGDADEAHVGELYEEYRSGLA